MKKMAWGSGMIKHWNMGFRKSISDLNMIPSFQYSIIPE
jgi:hypothetical protein